MVVPLVSAGKTQMVLDVDSDLPDDFSSIDVEYLEEIVRLIRVQHFSD